MIVIGNGFVARHLRPVRGRHPGATVIAAGVSSLSERAQTEFDREKELVHDTVRHCRLVGRTVVFFSTASAALYGCTRIPAEEDTPVQPVSLYGQHKAALEAIVAGSGARWLILRTSHLAGPGQRAEQLLPSLVAQVRSGKVLVHRNAYRDMLDVRHMVCALDGILAAGAPDQIVNVASGVPEPIERIIAGIECRLGTSARRQMADATPSRALVSITRLRSLVPEVADFGFGPRYLPALLDRYVGRTGRIR